MRCQRQRAIVAPSADAGVARRYLERDGLDIACVPSLVDVDIADAERTAVKFVVVDPALSRGVEVSRTFTPVAPAAAPHASRAAESTMPTATEPSPDS